MERLDENHEISYLSIIYYLKFQKSLKCIEIEL